MSSVDPALSLDARRHFLLALRRVLRPIIRLMIRNGIGYAEFADVARGAYVESALRDTIDDGTKMTRDDVARVTGIPRQRVDHYIDDEGAQPKALSTMTRVLSEVLHYWHTDRRYLGPNDSPIELKLDATSGPSFKSLVKQINPEENPELVLEELLRTASITYVDEQHVRALTRYFIWRRDSTAGIEYFGTSLARLTRTLEHNAKFTNADEKRLERCVFADKGLPRHLLPSFQDHALERTNEFLSDLDDWLARFSDTTESKEDARVSTGVNIFLYVEEPPDQRALATLIQPRRTETPQNGEHIS